MLQTPVNGSRITYRAAGTIGSFFHINNLGNSRDADDEADNDDR
jgi:hypothetical protein